jgi:hypothetical protein
MLLWHDLGLYIVESNLIAMKKKYVIGAIPIIAIMIPVLLNAQPPHAKAWGKRGKHDRDGDDDRYEQRIRSRVYYEFYPSLNVYYNPGERRYWYPQNGVWIQANVLPERFILSNKRRQKVWCYDDEAVWVNQRYYADMPVIVAPQPRTGVSVNINARF